MYQYESYRVQAAYAQIQRHQSPVEARALSSSLRLYQQARTRAMWTRAWSTLRRKPYRLLPLSQIEASGQVTARRFLGLRCVPIEHICGSSGRSGDFDAAFRPLRGHSRGRWVSVAVAMQCGVALPPVTLVQVQDLYFVVDGHHRISVTKALRQKEVDAEVVIWDLFCPSPSLEQALPLRPVQQPT